jgi:LmbE family N-acetylglucosaminyl deacetylase
MPPGYDDHEISHVVDISDVWDEKVRAMHCHESQRHDIDRILQVYKDAPKAEYFIELTKERNR